ncbi:MAG: hypothetical protein M3094_08765, partial [Actinomycetia bacterium]|nr:hypothetical protein [Actinomycetes bacterium]
DPDVYERHWGTPHGLLLAPIAEAMGVPSITVETRESLAAAVTSPIEGPELIEIRTDRQSNRAHHDAIRGAVAAALRLGGGEEIEQRP